MTAQRDADLARLHVLVPLRSLSGGKARLGGAIDAEERETLLRGLLRQTLSVLHDWYPSATVHLVSADASVLAEATTSRVPPSGIPEAQRAAVRPLLQTGEGLNEALVMARDDALASGATATLILPADLPYLSVGALDRMLDAADAAIAAGSGRPIVVISPADARRGTNALLLSPPDVIEPCFGPSSLEAHLRAAARVDASTQVVEDAELGFDLDTPDDLERLEPALLEALTRLGEDAVGAASR